MRIIDPGHVYQLEDLDVPDDERRQWMHDHLVFVKREGERYPGNVGSHPGTTTQEVLRALIDRAKYVDAQNTYGYNDGVISRMRECIKLLEMRAYEIRGISPWDHRIFPIHDVTEIESLPTCIDCGHVCCTVHAGSSG